MATPTNAKEIITYTQNNAVLRRKFLKMQIKTNKKARWHRFNYDNHALLQLFTRRVKSVLFDGGDEATPKVPTTVPQSQMYQGFEVVLKKQAFS